MTCVVGIRKENGVHVAFDSCSADSAGRATVRRDPKGSQLTDWLAFGYTFSYRYGQILQHHLEVDETWDHSVDEHTWMVRTFVPAARAALSEHGWMKKQDEREEAGQMLIAVRNRVFVLNADMSVAESADDWDAVGAGADEAKGALAALSELNRLRIVALPSTGDEAEIALRAAEHLSCYVRPPYHHFETVAA